jgi:hypothetical protein
MPLGYQSIQLSVTSYLAALFCYMVTLMCGVMRISRLARSAYPCASCGMQDVLFVDLLRFCGQQAIR